MRHRGWSISENEVEFLACYLAEPAVQGGIVRSIDYNRPRIKSTASRLTISWRIATPLLALRELAEFFSLPFDSLSIFDAYPFITEKKLDQEDVDHSESHTTFHEMILEKRPHGYCQVGDPIFQGFYPRSHCRNWLPVQCFPSPTIRYCGLTLFLWLICLIPSILHELSPAPRSVFRQLQILEFCPSLWGLWGTWQEKARCADLRGKVQGSSQFS